MARAKKDAAKSAPEDKMLTLSLSDYLKSTNETAHALTIYHSMATSAMQATSTQLNAINAAFSNVQATTQRYLAANNIDIGSIDATAYGAIIHVLSMDKDSINPMGPIMNFQMPFTSTAPAPALKSADGKVKREKKPKAPRDPNAPKRPLTGYLFYYTENKEALQDRLQKETGANVPKGRVQEEGKNVWNAMPEAEKETWKARYREKWIEYQQELREYQAKGGLVDPKLLSAADPDAVPPADHDDDDDDEDDEEEESTAKPSAAIAANDDSDDSDDDEDDEEEEEVEKPKTPPQPKKAAKAKAPKSNKKEETASAKKKAAPAELSASTPAKKSKKAKEDAPAAEETSSKKRKAKEQDTPDVKKSKKSKGDDAAKAERKKKRKSGEFGADY